MEKKPYSAVKAVPIKPEASFRANGVSVSVFRNKAEDGREFLKFAVQRSYRDAAGEFQSSNSFGLADLPVLASLLELAFKHAYEDSTVEDSEE
jgi:hypothetical protein